jgi:hypothetical protein
MSWSQAKVQIAQSIKVGTGLNTANSSHRVVISLRNDISSARYCYNNEDGFQVQIGSASSISIPFSMLKSCYGALSSKNGYDGDFFRQHFPKQAADHPCHVHVVGQILVRAGLAARHGNSYR